MKLSKERGKNYEYATNNATSTKNAKGYYKEKEEIDGMEFLGKSEWVEIVFNGKREIKSFKILKDVIDEDDKEMLEDMIMLAIKDAFSKIDKETESKLGSYASMNGLFSMIYPDSLEKLINYYKKLPGIGEKMLKD